MNRIQFSSVVLLSCGLVLMAGCFGGTKSVQLPSFDPEGSAELAMEMYDTDGDGYVAGDELEKAPGLNAAKRNLDTDGDGKIAEEEIAARIQYWKDMKIGLMSFSCDVYLGRQPLEGATITYEPESFLGDVVQAGVGQTALGGTARPKVPKENRPSPDSPPGMQPGLYKVRISQIVGGEETIPAKYNSETILGHEVSNDDPAILNRQVVYRLDTK